MGRPALLAGDNGDTCFIDVLRVRIDESGRRTYLNPEPRELMMRGALFAVGCGPCRTAWHKCIPSERHDKHKPSLL